MSKIARATRITVPEIRARKGGDKIVCLTAYTAPMAELLDPHCDILLVGDSVGTAVHGLSGSIGVTLDMMLLHGQAVMRGSTRAMVVVDLPFGSYERSPGQAYKSASRLMRKSGCQAVKVETGDGVIESIAFLAGRGVPVVGHVGLRPQAANSDGGFKAKGRTAAERARVLDDAKAAEAAGAFAVVVEGVAPDLADEVTRSITIPTIGIGASGGCDGQVLVSDDMLGLFEWTPKFVRRYADLRAVVDGAVTRFADDVRAGRFPAEAELYKLRLG